MKPNHWSATVIIVLLCVLPVLGIGQKGRDSLQQRLNDPHLSPLETWQVLQSLITIDQGDSWDSMLVYSQRALNIAQQHLPKKIAESALWVARSLEKREAYREMTDTLYYALEHLDRSEPSATLGQIYTDLGHFFYRQQQVGKCKNYFVRAYRIYAAVRDTTKMVVGLNNLYNAYENIRRDSARFYLDAALDLALEGEVVEFLPHIYNNLGSQIEFGDTPTPEAIGYFQKAFKSAEAIEDTAGMMIPAVNLGLSHEALEQYDSALYYLSRLEQWFEEDRDELNILVYGYMGLAQTYEDAGQPWKALDYYKKYTAANDSLRSRVFASDINEIEARYQNEEKEAQLARQQLELEQQAALRNLIIFISLGTIILIVAILGYLRNQQRLRAREAELSLEAARTRARQLRELDQLKSNFFANISHEFRTPLTLLLGPLEALETGKLNNPRQYLAMMRRNGNRLLDLINQLLDLSKLESGKMELQTRAGDLGRFLSQLAAAMQSWADRKSIDYQINIPEGIPTVLFDQDKMEKIVTNLLSNALKFTPEGGVVSCTVVAEAKAHELDLRLAVKDTGPGIPASEIPHIFGRFYQATQEQDGTASTGIGLALSKELVNLHGGTIWVESELGKGSCFTVHLSLEVSDEPAKQITPIVEKADEGTNMTKATLLPVNHGKSDLPLLLIVEDNPDLRTYIQDQLADEYRIIEAENGAAGFEKAVARIPDLIITDVMMPEMNGTELTAKLKQDERSSHIPVIMLTAKAEQEDKLEGLETGADDYLLKPFNTRELGVRVRNLIEQRRLLREKFARSSLLAPQEVAVSSVDEQFLNRLLEIIEKHIDDEAFSVEEMGRQVGLSRSQLHRKLKALTGQPPNVFIRKIRLQRAYKLLSQRAGNTSEIAFMTGFSSVSYFSKCFKDQFKVTPSEVLQQM